MIDLGFFIFLSSGLFLGWSLGANDAANIFGTAVTSRMLRFRTAAILCAVFVIIGAVISGAGASHGLGKLGAVNALAGSFTVALSAAANRLHDDQMGTCRFRPPRQSSAVSSAGTCLAIHQRIWLRSAKLRAPGLPVRYWARSLPGLFTWDSTV